VKGDASQIEQVIINLITNARDAVSAGGAVHVSTQSVQLRERLAALELVATTLDRAVTKRGRAELELTPDEVHAWMGVLNDARLALGTRLGITEQTEAEEIDPSGPDAAAHALYTWLTWVQNDLVETLLD
jgi:hypothetical protein